MFEQMLNEIETWGGLYTSIEPELIVESVSFREIAGLLEVLAHLEEQLEVAGQGDLARCLKQRSAVLAGCPSRQQMDNLWAFAHVYEGFLVP